MIPSSTCETMDSSNSDWLSELPDSLILEILSLLPMNDVIGTMLLSKRWLHLWTTVPCLDFDYNDEDKYKYKEFVSGALAHWKGSKIRKCSFRFNLDSIVLVDSWLLFAIEKQVEELHVSRGVYCRTDYCPPQHLYSCSSLSTMSLSSCYLRIDEAVQWSRLKSLEVQVVEPLSENAMNRILAGAPLLEELILDYFYSKENLNIRSTSLKILELDMCYDSVYMEVLRISAPNLLDMEIHGPFYGTCLLDVPSLTTARICFQEASDEAYHNFDLRLPPIEMFHQLYQSIRHVEKLTLSRVNSKPLLSMKNNFEFPNVKSLSFYAGCGKEMLGVLRSFPNLTTLDVEHDEDMFSEADFSEADFGSPFVPFLKRVEITWYMCNDAIIPALEILLKNAKLLDKFVFRANWSCWNGDKPELLLSKSASSPTAELTIIHHG